MERNDILLPLRTFSEAGCVISSCPSCYGSFVRLVSALLSGLCFIQPFVSRTPKNVELMLPRWYTKWGQVKMDAVILRCLEKDPDKGFQTVQEIVAVLMSCLHNEPSVGDRRAKALCLAGRKAETSTAPWKNRILTQAPFNPDPAGYNLRNRGRLRGNQCG